MREFHRCRLMLFKQRQQEFSCILQVRSKISTFGEFSGPTEVTCGGNALKFYVSVRLNIKRTGFVKKDEEVFASDIRRPTTELLRFSISIVTSKLPTRFVDDILSKLIPPVHNDKPKGNGANKNN